MTVPCTSCGGKKACFCKRGLGEPAVVPLSPAMSALSQRSNLSISIDVKKSPTFSFTPWSGYGNTVPPTFSLGGPAEGDAPSPRPRSESFFDGGTPTWIFYGWTFAMSATGLKQKELKKLIERHGGSVARILHRRVHLLVATEIAVRRNTQKVRKARDKGIAIVTPAFLHDSLKAGEVLSDVAAYEPRPPLRQRAAAAASMVLPTALTAVPPEDGFNWRREIRRRLRENEDGALRRRRLREDVLARHLTHLGSGYAASWWSAHRGEHMARFKRQLKRARKAGKLKTEGRMVQLV